MVTNICNPTYAATPQDNVWDWMLSCQDLLQHHTTKSLRLNFVWLANICSATPRTQKFETTTLFVLPTSALCNTTRQKFETELFLSYQHLLCNTTRHKFETATLFASATSANQHLHCNIITTRQVWDWTLLSSQPWRTLSKEDCLSPSMKWLNLFTLFTPFVMTIQVILVGDLWNVKYGWIFLLPSKSRKHLQNQTQDVVMRGCIKHIMGLHFWTY